MTRKKTASRAELQATRDLMDSWAGLVPITWDQPIDEARARIELTDASFDMVVALGERHCECRAAGMWYANEPAYYQAYKTAARVARERRK